MSYSIEYYTSVGRYCVVATNESGYFTIIAGYATHAKAQAKLDELLGVA